MHKLLQNWTPERSFWSHCLETWSSRMCLPHLMTHQLLQRQRTQWRQGWKKKLPLISVRRRQYSPKSCSSSIPKTRTPYCVSNGHLGSAGNQMQNSKHISTAMTCRWCFWASVSFDTGKVLLHGVMCHKLGRVGHTFVVAMDCDASNSVRRAISCKWWSTTWRLRFKHFLDSSIIQRTNLWAYINEISCLQLAVECRSWKFWRSLWPWNAVPVYQQYFWKFVL